MPFGGSGLAGEGGLDLAQRAPVALPAGFARLCAVRLLLAQRQGRDAPARDAEREIVVADRLGSLLAEGQVVGDGAALVAVAFDEHLPTAVLLDRGGVALEDRPRLVGENVAVVAEADRAQLGGLHVERAL